MRRFVSVHVYKNRGGIRILDGKPLEDYLICGNTDGKGEYELPIIIGSRVGDVK